MHPTPTEFVLTGLVSGGLVMAMVVLILFRHSFGLKKHNRKIAEDSVTELLAEIDCPNRHRWVQTPDGEAIQFIYLLLGRNTVDPNDGHLVWAEVTLRKMGAEATIFHAASIQPSDDYLNGIVDTLRNKKWKVSVVQTNEQPDLRRTGVKDSEVIV